MTKTAFIVVDMQNDFVRPDGALYVPGAEEIVDDINGMLMTDNRYDLAIATQDWHPPGHKSFASSHEGEEVGSVIDLNGLDQVLWPDHCVQGTEGAEFVEGLRTDLFDKVFRKGTDPEVDSYSGFYDNGHRGDTGLADYLRSEGVTEVLIAGVATDYCVLYTFLDAVEEGFDAYLCDKVTRGVNIQEGDAERAIQRMRELEPKE